MVNIEELKNDIKGYVNEFRYQHCLMVADEARKLANTYGYDEDKSYITGLVHDIAKDFKDEKNIELVNKYNLDKHLLDDNYKNILHADIGACFVKEKYNFDDDMCNAIRYHAIGNENMDLLAKIIFIADKIGRNNLSEEYKVIKDVSYQNIDKAIILYIELLRKSLKERGLNEQVATIKLYDKLNREN